MKQLVMVGGGVRSGKSAFALRLAQSLGKRRTFVATAQALDDEMDARIARHIAERQDRFVTVEAPLALPQALGALAATEVVVVDCLTLWLSNLLLAGATDDDAVREIASLCAALRARAWHAIVVTNEVGMGVVPEHRLGRRFRDLSGHAHQALAHQSDALYAGLMGCMLRLRPAPVTVLGAHDDLAHQPT